MASVHSTRALRVAAALDSAMVSETLPSSCSQVYLGVSGILSAGARALAGKGVRLRFLRRQKVFESQKSTLLPFPSKGSCGRHDAFPSCDPLCGPRGRRFRLPHWTRTSSALSRFAGLCRRHMQNAVRGHRGLRHWTPSGAPGQFLSLIPRARRCTRYSHTEPCYISLRPSPDTSHFRLSRRSSWRPGLLLCRRSRRRRYRRDALSRLVRASAEGDPRESTVRTFFRRATKSMSLIWRSSSARDRSKPPESPFSAHILLPHRQERASPHAKE
jgi:hypothetical protein